MKIRSTSLERGEIIPISPNALVRAFENFTTKSLILGHMAEYTHTELLIKQGFKVIESGPHALYDRELPGFPVPKHDDKVATFEAKGGTLSRTHNISHAEHDAWVNILRDGGDVAIQSFEYVDDTYREIIYRGTISFRALHAAPSGAGIRAGVESYYFDREKAYQFNLLHG
jgi:hypothetical protein